MEVARQTAEEARVGQGGAVGTERRGWVETVGRQRGYEGLLRRG